MIIKYVAQMLKKGWRIQDQMRSGGDNFFLCRSVGIYSYYKRRPGGQLGMYGCREETGKSD